jgi:hypothetical protein
VTSNAGSGIFVVSLDSGAVQPVLPNESSSATYVEPGYLLYLHGDSLMEVVASRFQQVRTRLSLNF